jgi:hypothetical protein
MLLFRERFFLVSVCFLFFGFAQRARVGTPRSCPSGVEASVFILTMRFILAFGQSVQLFRLVIDQGLFLFSAPALYLFFPVEGLIDPGKGPFNDSKKQVSSTGLGLDESINYDD